MSVSMNLTYISVSKSIPLAVTGPNGQLTSNFINGEKKRLNAYTSTIPFQRVGYRHGLQQNNVFQGNYSDPFLSLET